MYEALRKTPSFFPVALSAMVLLFFGCGERQEPVDQPLITINLSHLLAPSADAFTSGSKVTSAKLWVDGEETDFFDVCTGEFEETLPIGPGVREVSVKLYGTGDILLYESKEEEVEIVDGEPTEIYIDVNVVGHSINSAFTVRPCEGSEAICVDASGSYSSHFSSEGLSYEWDWGDGTGVDDEPIISHTYADGGEYKIMLTVKDCHSSDSDSKEIIIPYVTEVLPAPGIISPNIREFTVTFNTPVIVESGNISINDVPGNVTAEGDPAEEILFRFDNLLPEEEFDLVVEGFESIEGMKQPNPQTFHYSREVLAPIVPIVLSVSPPGGNISSCNSKFLVTFNIPVAVKSSGIGIAEVSGSVTTEEEHSNQIEWEANKPIPIGQYTFVVRDFKSENGEVQREDKTVLYTVASSALQPDEVQIIDLGLEEWIPMHTRTNAPAAWNTKTRIVHAEFFVQELFANQTLHWSDAIITMNGERIEGIQSPIDEINVGNDNEISYADILFLGSMREGAEYRAWFSVYDISGRFICLDISFDSSMYEERMEQ